MIAEESKISRKPSLNSQHEIAGNEIFENLESTNQTYCMVQVSGHFWFQNT